jgi:hypothetical protein
MSQDMNYISLYQVQMYTQTGNRDQVWEIRDSREYALFISNANNSVLYQTESLDIGQAYFPDIDL